LKIIWLYYIYYNYTHLDTEKECEAKLEEIEALSRNNSVSSTINRASIKTSSLEDLGKQKDYEISLLKNQIKGLERRQEEDKSVIEKKDNQINLLTNELNSIHQQNEECSKKTNGT
jgi:predicted RNase H-like nuclease (RuvC/YqgF family)